MGQWENRGVRRGERRTELRHCVGKCCESVQMRCDSAAVGWDKSLYLTETVKQSGIDRLLNRRWVCSVKSLSIKRKSNSFGSVLFSWFFPSQLSVFRGVISPVSEPAPFEEDVAAANRLDLARFGAPVGDRGEGEAEWRTKVVRGQCGSCSAPFKKTALWHAESLTLVWQKRDEIQSIRQLGLFSFVVLLDLFVSNAENNF